MGLRLHNTLTRTKDDFVPIDPANVRMYVCGPTVYDFAHIGNARPLIVFDVLFRLLKHIYPGSGTAADGSRVTYVRNITDVDDKIIARAAEEYPDLPLNEAIRKVTEKTETQFHEDVAALGCLPPTVEPRATQHIEEMKAMIEELVAKGFAYVAADHVLFRVSAMKDYGRLSNRTLDEMVAGARVEVAPYKQDPMDFVLWKPSKQEARSEATGTTTGGEPAWPSPAGIAAPGRPGWHLECSAMSEKWLWEEAKSGLSPAGLAHPHEFDIHGGGLDLIFPHHENEIAQSRCAHGTPLMARYWLHNGFLQVEGEKMSKSLGNFVTIRQMLNRPVPAVIVHDAEVDPRGILHKWKGLSVRLAMLMTQYRQPLDWTERRLLEASDELSSWYDLLRSINYDARTARSPDDTEAVVEALADDMNTPLAITHLRQAAKSRRFSELGEGMRLLGLLDPDLVEENYAETEVSQEIEQQIAARAAARKAKNFADADRIRAELDAMGIALKDSKDPATGELKTTWEVKR